MASEVPTDSSHEPTWLASFEFADARTLAFSDKDLGSVECKINVCAEVLAEVVGLQHQAVSQVRGDAFVDVEMPPPLPPRSGLPLPELIIDTGESTLQAPQVGVNNRDIENSPPATSALGSRGKVGDERPALSVGRRPKPLTNWLNASWNLACIASLAAVFFLARAWLLGGDVAWDRSTGGNPDDGVVIAYESEDEGSEEAQLTGPLDAPASRITGLLPMESDLDYGIWSGPLTDGRVNTASFIEDSQME